METPASNPANASQTPEDVAARTPEALIAQWEEPRREIQPLDPTTRLLVMGGGPFIALVFILMAVFLHRFSYYLAAVAALAAMGAVLAQSRQTTPTLTISLTNTRLVVGKKNYPLTDLSGFWMQKDGEHLMIHVEMTKATLVPITFAYSSVDQEDARETLSKALPEVEARIQQIGDSVNQYFRL
jgi:hypothetical protein